MTDAKAAEQLRVWAAERFGDLTSAEDKLLEKVPTGEVCDVRSGGDEEDDPAKADDWPGECIVHAALIRWLCVDPDASKLVDVKGIQLGGARIEGKLDLKDAKIPFGLQLVKCRICEPMTLLGAEVWRVSLNGSHTRSITMDGAIVRQDVFLNAGFTAQGEVRLLGASIGGDLECSGGTFKNKGEHALIADRMTVKGDVFLRDDFFAQGEVRLLGASIGGDLVCNRGTFENEGKDKYALIVSSAMVDGFVYLSDTFKARGEVNLVHASIGGGLQCTKGKFENEGADALNADGIKVKGGLFLHKGFSVSGSVHLLHASVGVLADHKNAWPDSCRGKLYLDGFKYGAIAATAEAPTDAAFRIRWLELQDQEDRFLPKPYEQLAKVLREMGHPSDAKTVMIAKEEARRRYGNLAGWTKRWHWLIGKTIGYGYRTQLAGYYLAGLLVVGAVLFSLGSSAGLMRPTDAKGVADSGFFQTVAAGEGTPSLVPLVYSLDALVPIVDLHQQRFWLPMARENDWGYALRAYLWLHIAAGWFFSTMVVIGVTGLARPG